MAKKDAKKETCTEDTQKNAIVEKIQKTSESVSEKLKAVNEKYVAKTLEKGKATLKEYNEKYLAKNIEKGRETWKEYNQKYIAKNIRKSKEYLDGPYKKITGAIDEMLAKGRDMEKDYLKKLDTAVEKGRKIMYKIPMVETVEKKFADSLNALPGMINMPNKGEIEKLTLAMQTLNSNIETLKKQNSI